ncbi:MAG: alpha/beta hydrolase [Myxococcota bacterium]
MGAEERTAASQRSIHSERFSVGGCDLYTECVGDGAPVLLIHGAGAFADLFHPCFDALGEDAQLVAYDRRGCARSKHPPVREFARHVEDAAALLRDRFDAPAVLVGWSAGAMIALELVIRHPDRVRSLVLAEPPLQLKAPRPLALGAVARWEWTRHTRGNHAGALVFYRWVSQYRGAGNAFDAYPDAWRDTMLDNADALFTEIRFGGGALGEFAKRRDLAAIEHPIRILVGSRSAPVFAPAARYLERVSPRSTWIDVPGASHMIPTDAPEAVADAVRAALAE